jgi:hypothetical protein
VRRGARIAKITVVTLGIAAVAIVTTTVIWWTRIPRFEGRTMYQWFDGVDFESGPRAWQRTTSAFVMMGTNALPFLFDRLEGIKPPPKQDLFLSLINHRLVPVSVRMMLGPRALGFDERYRAFSILQSVSLKGSAAHQRLEQILEANTNGSYYALELIRKLGPSASNSVPAVARCLSTNGAVGLVALSAFAEITPVRSPHLELLREAIRLRQVHAGRALPVLKNLEGRYDDLLPFLGEELCATNASVNTTALRTCGEMGVDREVLLPQFASAMKHPDSRYRALLLQRVRKLEVLGTKVFATAEAALDDEFYYVRAEAARTLGAMGALAQSALPRLKARESDSNAEVAEAAANARKTIEDGMTGQ